MGKCLPGRRLDQRVPNRGESVGRKGHRKIRRVNRRRTKWCEGALAIHISIIIIIHFFILTCIHFQEISSVSRKISLVSLPLLYALMMFDVWLTNRRENRLFPTDDDIHSIVVSFPKRPLLSMRDGSVSSFPRGTKAVLFFFLLLFRRRRRLLLREWEQNIDRGGNQKTDFTTNAFERHHRQVYPHQSNAQFTDQRGSYLRFEPTDKNENNLYVNVVFSKKRVKALG